MSDYKKQEDILAEIERFEGYLDEDMINRIKIAILRLPSTDVEPIKRGRWIEPKGFWGYDCPFCGYTSEDTTNYCPNCGAQLNV